MKKATSIKIARAEGPHYLCVTREFEGSDCWSRASAWLVSQGHTYPKTGGYDKHDFTVTFDDGETYEGRLDCQHWTLENTDLNVAKHVRDFIEFHAGERRPAHMSVEQYKLYLNRMGEGEVKEAQAFLAEYEIPLS